MIAPVLLPFKESDRDSDRPQARPAFICKLSSDLLECSMFLDLIGGRRSIPPSHLIRPLLPSLPLFSSSLFSLFPFSPRMAASGRASGRTNERDGYSLKKERAARRGGEGEGEECIWAGHRAQCGARPRLAPHERTRKNGTVSRSDRRRLGLVRPPVRPSVRPSVRPRQVALA